MTRKLIVAACLLVGSFAWMIALPSPASSQDPPAPRDRDAGPLTVRAQDAIQAVADHLDVQISWNPRVLQAAQPVVQTWAFPPFTTDHVAWRWLESVLIPASLGWYRVTDDPPTYRVLPLDDLSSQVPHPVISSVDDLDDDQMFGRKVFRMEHILAADARDAIDACVSQPGTSCWYESRTDTLIVTGNRSSLAIASKIIERMDCPPDLQTHSLTVEPGRTERVVRHLRELFLGDVRRGKLVVSPLHDSNTFYVRCFGDLLPAIVEAAETVSGGDVLVDTRGDPEDANWFANRRPGTADAIYGFGSGNSVIAAEKAAREDLEKRVRTMITNWLAAYTPPTVNDGDDQTAWNRARPGYAAAALARVMADDVVVDRHATDGIVSVVRLHAKLGRIALAIVVEVSDFVGLMDAPDDVAVADALRLQLRREGNR